MAKKQVIDISQFNPIQDWQKVKQTGLPVVIRIGYRGSKTGLITYDPTFKANKAAVQKYDIPHSFYFFPCSITKAEAIEEAHFVKTTIQTEKISMPIFLDSQVVQRDKSGRSDKLSKEKRTEMLRIICEEWLNAGIPCGVYASRAWLYNNLDMSKIPAAARHNTWVAQYGVSQNKYNEQQVLWQYTSKGTVNGIKGVVDLSYVMDEFNMDALKKATPAAPKKEEEQPKTKSELEKIIEVAKAELGYLEKKSNSSLDSKTANAGYNNYTKYWRDVKPAWNGSAWCACFITWVFQTALGKSRATELLKHYPYLYCPTLGSLFTKHSNPEVGDIVIFWRNGTFAHTGLVIAVNGDQFTTIEGNTSGASGVVANGGGVCQKTYCNSKLPGTKFCRPNYSSTSISTPAKVQVNVTDDMHTAKYKGIVATKSSPLNIRLQPNSNAKTCSFSPLKKGTEVGVCYEVGDWYLIKYDGKFGYAYSSYIAKRGE